MHPNASTWIRISATFAFALACSACGSSTDDGAALGGVAGGSGPAAGGIPGAAGSESTPPASSGSSGAATGNGGAATGSGGATASGSGEFPCDVAQLLASKCQSCHRMSPPGSLLTAADFRRASVTDSQKTVGEIALARLMATDATHMPPAPLSAATPAEVQALTTWVQQGAPATTCGQDVPVPTPAPDPYDTPSVCTSMKRGTTREGASMRPGEACISCHAKEGEGPAFSIAGTLFPTPHEPNDCVGVPSTAGAQIVITEKNGTVHTLSVNDAGNFSYQSRSFGYPYQAKVVYQGRERQMVETQTSGDCNVCHSETGTQNAPGRIFLP